MKPLLLQIGDLRFHAYPSFLSLAFLTVTLLAAREGRLLSLTGETGGLHQRLGSWAGILSHGVAVGVTLILAVASFKLMLCPSGSVSYSQLSESQTQSQSAGKSGGQRPRRALSSLCSKIF